MTEYEAAVEAGIARAFHAAVEPLRAEVQRLHGELDACEQHHRIKDGATRAEWERANAAESSLARVEAARAQMEQERDSLRNAKGWSCNHCGGTWHMDSMNPPYCPWCAMNKASESRDALAAKVTALEAENKRLRAKHPFSKVVRIEDGEFSVTDPILHLSCGHSKSGSVWEWHVGDTTRCDDCQKVEAR